MKKGCINGCLMSLKIKKGRGLGGLELKLFSIRYELFSVLVVFDQLQELVPGRVLVAEAAEHSGSNHA